MPEEDHVYTPETIQDQPFPGGEALPLSGSGEVSSTKVERPTSTSNKPFTIRRVAYEVIGTALNTKSKKILAQFEFTKSGALQIGEYENGVSGDIKISPNGIVARNSTGTTTFALDGDTGDATFSGTIQTGTLISGLVVVGDNSIIIDGENKTIIISDDNGIPQILIGYQAQGF